MGIVYSKADRTFTIQTKNTTYQMQVDPYGFLLPPVLWKENRWKLHGLSADVL